MDKQLKKTIVDLFADTIKFYGGDYKNRKSTRSISGGKTIGAYNAKNGNKCAIARLLTNKALKHIDESFGAKQAIDTLIRKLGPDEQVFKNKDHEEVPGHYLFRLQRLHDLEGNWDAHTGGLSIIGIRKVKEMILDLCPKHINIIYAAQEAARCEFAEIHREKL